MHTDQSSLSFAAVVKDDRDRDHHRVMIDFVSSK
ncbi:hypothetical protein TYRP_017455 [Tyrophagus putrescentiae]|nr:hypothetical protein TYRP_017455 [Tyrophagus putrescentiae]